MQSLWDIANAQLRELAVYEPGKPIEETARELKVDPAKIVKLASNENPLGPSPKAVKAMRAALNQTQLYPDGGGFYLRNALAERLGLSPENIILGNGSNEIIEFLGHAFLKTDEEVIASEHAFIAYKLVAALFGARIIETFSPNYAHHLDGMLAAITRNTRLVFIANPNNPTGTLLSEDKIDNYMARVPKNVVTVFDEAYYEFIDGPPDTLKYVREGRNIIVLRTFSKIHGLAGARVGYGIARREMIEVLHKTRQPFNVNVLAQIGALAALQDKAHEQKTKQVVDEGRAYLEEQFAGLSLKFVPSSANFIMVNVGDGPATFKKLLARNIIVRPLKGYNLPEWVRISIGTMKQNKKCIAALKEVLSKDRPA
jgi:histidinol-phosphate aminotransferase